LDLNAIWDDEWGWSRDGCIRWGWRLLKAMGQFWGKCWASHNQWGLCGILIPCHEGWRHGSSQITLAFLVLGCCLQRVVSESNDLLSVERDVINSIESVFHSSLSFTPENCEVKPIRKIMKMFSWLDN